MLALTHTSYLLLFLIIILEGVILSIYPDISLQRDSLFLIIVLLLPGIEVLLNSIKPKIYNHLSIGVTIKTLLLLLSLSVGAYFYGLSFINIHIILLSASVLIFKIDTKVIFIGALSFIFLTFFSIPIEDKLLSETLAISVYYLLIIGVFFEIFTQSTFLKKDNKHFTSFGIIWGKNILKLHKEIISSLLKKLKAEKISILKEIGEYKETSTTQIKPQKIKLKNLFSKKIKRLYNKKQNPGIVIKLLCYSAKKYYHKIINITFCFFIISVFLAILNLKYEITLLTSISIYLLFIHYILAKYKKENIQLTLNKKHSPKFFQVNGITAYSTNFFLQKATLFSSIGLIASYILSRSMDITLTSYIYILIGLIFFSSYYLYFSIVGDILWLFTKKIGSKVNSLLTAITAYNYGSFFIKYTYLILSFCVFSSLLLFVGIKEGTFVTLYKDYKDSQGFPEFSVVPDPPRIQTDEEKRAIGEKLRQLSLQTISNEAQALSSSGTTASGSVITSEEEELIIPTETKLVRDVYTFTKSLTVGSKGNEVENLENIMRKTGYLSETPDTLFTEETKNALSSLLKTECGWPESTKGILGFKAQQCVYGLEIEIEIEKGQ